MNPGTGFVWHDQEAAERVAARRFFAYLGLVEDLEAMAEATNSLAAYRLAAAHRARIEDINF